MLVDISILLLAAITAYISRHSGFIRQAGATLGFFGGIWLGSIIVPHVISRANSIDSRVVIMIVVLLGMALLGLMLGELIGIHYKHRFMHRGRFNVFDNGVGAIVSFAAVIAASWLLAGASNHAPRAVQQSVQDSYVLRSLNLVLPPSGNIINSVSHVINPNGFPDVFIGTEPIPRTDVDLPTLGSLAAAVTATRDSVVRIEGQGCGGIVTGSGFVAQKDLVITNAHVVAGIRRPYVQDVAGTHRATVVVFDSKLDFAVLRVSGLAGKPLQLTPEKVPAQSGAVMLGYPGGGNFTAHPAAIVRTLQAKGHDIYGKSASSREVYELRTTIATGNSGGPLVRQNGDVIGVIFAESTAYDGVGYALTTEPLIPILAKAATAKQPAPHGSCTQ